MSATYYSREIKTPKDKQEGLANFVQMIINQIERGEINGALLTAVDLWNDVESADGPYRMEAKAGRKFAALQTELQQQHVEELARTHADAYEAGKAAAKREMAERLGLVTA